MDTTSDRAQIGRGASALVLDADMIPALTVARSLHRHGVRVELAAPDSVRERPLAAWSRACAALHHYPDPLDDAAAFRRWLRDIQARHAWTLIMPVTERTLVAVDETLQAALPLAMPPRDRLETVLDKAATLQLAEALGVPIPEQHRIDSESALESLSTRLEYPVVLKPQSSIAGDEDSGRAQFSVRHAFDAETLRREGRALLRHTPLLVQRRVPGHGVGIEVIAVHGRIALAFQHRRLHELPPSGGGSTYRRSETPDPRLLDAARRLIEALEWHGVAMVEFRRDPASDAFWLMEINGRFWGSLPLSVAAGADFPWLLYRLHTEGRLPEPIEPPRTDIHCRRLSSDLQWYEQVLRGVTDPRLFTRPSNRQLLRDALRCLSPRHRFDVQSLRDPLPGTIDLYRIVRDQTRRLVGRAGERLRRRRLGSPRARDRLRARCREARRLLFVCHGNINRSALAEAIARKRLPGHEARSAGFHPVEDRPADPQMVEVAAQAGFDLSASRSRVLDDAMLDWADLILVMEWRHAERILERRPDLKHRVALLGTLAPHRGDPEIADPYGHARETYVDCFRRIRQCLNALETSSASGPRV